MAIQTVSVGTTPNDGTGDPARTSFIKINDNFTQPENAASRLVATPAEAIAGTAGVLPDAEQVRLLIAQDVPAASTTVAGRVEKATNQEALDGVADKFPDAEGVHAAIRGLAVGTVSQSGGVPTGAIIERGSNANGEYTKFADGTVIMTRTHQRTGAVDFLSEGLYVAAVDSLDLPSSVVDVLYKSASMFGLATIGEVNSDGSNFNYAIISLTSRTSVSTTAFLTVIGRWY